MALRLGFQFGIIVYGPCTLIRYGAPYECAPINKNPVRWKLSTRSCGIIWNVGLVSPDAFLEECNHSFGNSIYCILLPPTPIDETTLSKILLSLGWLLITSFLVTPSKYYLPDLKKNSIWWRFPTTIIITSLVCIGLIFSPIGATLDTSARVIYLGIGYQIAILW